MYSFAELISSSSDIWQFYLCVKVIR